MSKTFTVTASELAALQSAIDWTMLTVLGHEELAAWLTSLPPTDNQHHYSPAAEREYRRP